MDDKIVPVIVNKYKDEENPVVVDRFVQKSTEEPVLLKKRKTTVRNISVDTGYHASTKRMKLADIARELLAFFRSRGYEYGETRAKCLIASMVSSRLVFINADSDELIDLLSEFFGCEKYLSEDESLRKITGSEAFLGIYKARFNDEACNIIYLQSSDNTLLEQFSAYVKSPSSHPFLRCEVTINDVNYKRIVIPENVWLFVKSNDDKNLSFRRYGSFAKLYGTRCASEAAEERHPSVYSIADPFHDVKMPPEEVWKVLDEITALFEKAGTEFSNRDYNMIDDYFLALCAMEIPPYDALDYTILNKILYITGNDSLKALRDYPHLELLKNTKKKTERY